MSGNAFRSAGWILAVAFAGVVLVGSLGTALSVAQTADRLTAHPKQGLVRIFDSPVPAGAFGYTFGAAGWPDAWSLFGVDPHEHRIGVRTVPWDSPISGRPLHEMLPSLLGGEDYFAAEPLTVLRYESAGDGLQAARVVHVQNRQPGFLQTSDSSGTRLQTLFGYAGAGATGEYDGSALRRMRQITGIVALSGTWGRVRLSDTNTRHRVGAHGGVEPFTSEYESIYQRLGARVRNDGDERQVLRNDLVLDGQTVVGGRDVDLTIYRTWHTLTFMSTTAPMRWRTARTGFAARAELGRLGLGRTGSDGGAALSFGAEARARRTDGADFVDLRSVLHWASPDSTSFRATLKPGAVQSGGDWFGAVDATAEWAGQQISASWEPLEESILDRTDFAGAVPQVWHVHGRVAAAFGPVSVAAAPWWRHWNALRVRQGGGTSYQAYALGAAASRYGVSVELDVEAGPVYLHVNPVLARAKADAAHPSARAWEDALPESWLTTRLGTRQLLFSGDLDLDASIRVRAWPTFTGRTLHTPTGLLVLRDPADRQPAGSGTIDLVFEGGIRGATVSLAYENLLSGTNVLMGNLIVPDYPLPQQRIRFGVRWPIMN
ncbi:MAG: hypothetical protein RIE53_10160 [Rhodothermales bacterium]